MRVLIVKASALGDIIHALPVLDYLKRAAPGIEIDWVAEEPFRDLLEGNPLISRLFLIRTKIWRKRPFARETRQEIGTLAAEMRMRAYDMVFDIQGNLKSGIVTALSGCSRRLGFDASVLQERANMLFTNRRIRPRPSDHHITDQYLRLVSAPFACDFSGMSLVTDIATNPEQEAIAAGLFSEIASDRIFLFHQGTTWDTKYWTEEGWQALGRRVLAEFPGAAVLFSWGNEAERVIAERLASALGPGARVIDRYPLKVLAAILKRVNVAVGGDTGPLHLAAAVGTPTVSLYRASDGSRSGPRGTCHEIIQAPMPCTRCFRTSCEQDLECRKSITAEMMFSAMQRVMTRCGKANG